MKEGGGNYGCFSCYLRGVDAVDIIVSAADTTATESISLKLSSFLVLRTYYMFYKETKVQNIST